MRDSEKTKEQLIDEIQETRRLLEAPDKREPQLSEDMFAKAFRASPDMIIITSVPEGIYLEVNDAFAHNVGYTREEIIGHPLEDYNFLATPQELEKMMSKLRNPGYLKNDELSFRMRSGEIQQWLCSADVVEIDGKKRMISVSVDITKRKKMEEALDESEQILAIAFQSSPQAISITTLSGGKFIEVNNSQERISGFTRGELIGHSAIELDIFNTPQDSQFIYRRLLETGAVSNLELQLRKKTGQLYPVLLSCQIIKIRGEQCIITSLTDLTERAQMERALRESEEKFSRAFSSSPNSICLFNPEDGVFADVNDSFLRFSGYTHDEIIGHTPDELKLWADPQERQKMGETIQATGKLSNMKIRSRMKTGEIRTGLFSAQSYELNGHQNMLLTINDITDQEKAEEAIAKEAILRRVLIQNSKDGIVILNKDGNVYDANRKFCEMLGYTPEEMKALNVSDWENVITQPELLEMLNSVNDQGDHIETQHRRKDGSVYDVEISTNGAVVSGQKLVFCVCRDITARKQMEKALRESEEMFSKAFHASPEVTAITTLDEGRYVDINENYYNVMGYSREELVGHTARELGIWARPEQRDNMFRKLAEQGKVSKQEYMFRTKSGEILTWLFSAVPVTIGDKPCLMGVSIDITAQKIIEAKARETENLKEVEILRRELLANVSHELRTPLASIKGFTTMLIDYGRRLKANEKLDYLKTIDNNADRMVELIEQLLEMSRLGSGMMSIRKKPADVKALCRSTIAAARKRAANHLFYLDLPKKLPLVDIDDDRIRQVLDHLIDNAVKYSKPGTEITLSVRKTPDDVLFVLADQGSGITDEDMPHIFERMFTSTNKSKSAVSGAGLGLSISKGLIEAHHGKIWFESEVGVGSKCFFTLPLKSDQVESGKL
jgi:PAS domain S-box-containing protein